MSIETNNETNMRRSATKELRSFRYSIPSLAQREPAGLSAERVGVMWTYDERSGMIVGRSYPFTSRTASLPSTSLSIPSLRFVTLHLRNEMNEVRESVNETRVVTKDDANLRKGQYASHSRSPPAPSRSGSPCSPSHS